jgi:hypothetical protein
VNQTITGQIRQLDLDLLKGKMRVMGQDQLHLYHRQP